MDLRSLYEHDPKSVYDLFNRALSLSNEEKYDQAETILRRFVHEFPDFDKGSAWYELAGLREDHGDMGGAEAAYREALKYWPEYDIYLLAFGFLLWRNRKHTEATAILSNLRAREEIDTLISREALESALTALEKGAPYEQYIRNNRDRSL